jgi:hypothetical protein
MLYKEWLEPGILMRRRSRLEGYLITQPYVEWKHTNYWIPVNLQIHLANVPLKNKLDEVIFLLLCVFCTLSIGKTNSFYETLESDFETEFCSYMIFSETPQTNILEQI